MSLGGVGRGPKVSLKASSPSTLAVIARIDLYPRSAFVNDGNGGKRSPIYIKYGGT